MINGVVLTNNAVRYTPLGDYAISNTRVKQTGIQLLLIIGLEKMIDFKLANAYHDFIWIKKDQLEFKLSKIKITQSRG